MVVPVGSRFHPTDEEIVGDYVRPKNLESDTSHVDEVMNTVDIYEFDPWELPCKSRMKSTDEVWYFFGCTKNQQSNGGVERTKSGSWNKTGVTIDVMRKGGGNREKIGEKRVFVFQTSEPKPKPDWVMHEYVATFSSPNQTMMTYTVCKVIFKGDPRDLCFSGEIEHHDHLSLIPPHVNNNNSGGMSTEVNHALQYSGFLHLEEDARIEDDTRRALNSFLNYDDDWNNLFINDEEQELVEYYINGSRDSDQEQKSCFQEYEIN